MPINALEIIESVAKQKEEKTRATVWVNEVAWNSFKAACEEKGVPASQILDNLMVLFLDDLARAQSKNKR